MALTRKFLTALGIDAEKQDEIINAHTETVDALKEQRDTFKADAEKYTAAQAELDKLKAEAAKDGGKNPFEVKYNAIKEEFDQYKADVEAEKTTARTKAAYKELLRSAGVSEKVIDAVLKASDLSNVKLDADGKIVDEKELTKAVQTEWADFIVTEGQAGANVPNPPANQPKIDYDGMSDADYYKATYEANKKK